MSDFFRNCRVLALRLAKDCRLEADRQPWRREYWICEAERHEERADWYSRRSFNQPEKEDSAA